MVRSMETLRGLWVKDAAKLGALMFDGVYGQLGPTRGAVKISEQQVESPAFGAGRIRQTRDKIDRLGLAISPSRHRMGNRTTTGHPAVENQWEFYPTGEQERWAKGYGLIRRRIFKTRSMLS